MAQLWAFGLFQHTAGFPDVSVEELVDRLATHRTIGKAPRAELLWLATHGQLRQIDTGKLVSRHDTEVEGLYVVLAGQFAIHVDRGNGRRRVMEWRGGDVGGVLPYSRLKKPPGDAIVEEASEILVLDRARLPELIRECQEVTAILVHVMTDRARQFTASDLHDEKMASLGTLAAGLAHELNNPASAATRCSKLLLEELISVESASRGLGVAGLSNEQLLELDRILGACLVNVTDSASAPSGLDECDLEDAVQAWLTSRGVEKETADAVMKSGVTIQILERVAAVVPPPALVPAVRWVASGTASRNLAMSIEIATSRIHQLVSAVKSFTYMDRGAMPELVDIARGLQDTCAVLKGKAAAKSVTLTVTAAADLPKIYAFGGEINQIWEQLLDNAIDAAPKGGHVSIAATREESKIVVCVTDDGPGIPDDIKPRIFDPFFTTKGVGEGVGLGLDIARRIVKWHAGQIDVSSKQGCTVFRVALPVSGPEAKRA